MGTASYRIERIAAIEAEAKGLAAAAPGDGSSSSIIRYMLHHGKVPIISQDELQAALAIAYPKVAQHKHFSLALAIAWEERHSQTLFEVCDLFDDIQMLLQP